MKTIDYHQELYVKLAKAGDPAAFCALFREQFNTVYSGIRENGESHDAACVAAIKKISAIYTKFTRLGLHDVYGYERWVAAKCGIKKIVITDPTAYICDMRDYEKQLRTALQRRYSEKLNGCMPSNNTTPRKRYKNRKPRIIIGSSLLAAVVILTFLFFSELIISVTFDRFEQQFEVSFPAIREELWKRSGLVHSVIEINAEALQPQNGSESVNGNE